MSTSFDKRIKVKITQPGMQTYTGYIRGTRFINGESVGDMPIRDALRLGASCQVSDMDGNIVSPNYHVFEDAATVTAADLAPEKAPEPEVVEEVVEEVADEEDEVVEFYEPDEEHKPSKVWTVAELEAIADADGIGGLREIGDTLGVRDRSIDGLIREIMKAQSGSDLADE